MDIRTTLAHRGIAVLAALVALAGCLFVSSLTAPAAYADPTEVNMTMDDMDWLGTIDNNDVILEKATVSDPSVLKIKTVNFDGETDIYAIPKKPGATTVILKKKIYDSESGDYSTVTYTYAYTISSTSCTLSGLNSAPLFKGKKFSIHKLFSDTERQLGGPITMTGTFVKGKGYKVYSGGKYVKFTKTGKVTVKFKTGGTVMDIVVPAVHTKSGAKKAMKKQIKADYGDMYKSISWKSFKVNSKGQMTYKVKAKVDGKRKTVYFVGLYYGTVLTIVDVHR